MNIWRKILENALYAPSPHNVQPWRVKILDDFRAELFIDSTRTLPKEDVTGSFIISTMGIFIEAIDILARRQNLKVEYELLHEPDFYAPAILKLSAPCLIEFAKLTLKPIDENDFCDNRYDEKLFLSRKTSRLHLKKEFVPDDAFRDLSEIAAKFNQNYTQIIDSKVIERILAQNTNALFEDLNSRGYHDEIVEWFRYSKRESETKRDGLDYRAMNTPRLMLWMTARMSWMMKTPVLKAILARTYRAQTGEVPTLGVISGAFWKPQDAINAGRFLMRFWLETARHNVYMHPFGNLVTNQKAIEFVTQETKIPDIWLVFKIGFSDEPPQSYRLPLEKVLV
ncbi:MAG: hypothetical protein H7Z37_06830 [Pyrinomonadaceae bacterium]|nr:hypothetical protein [Pyrinomonadaceae bacterium]